MAKNNRKEISDGDSSSNRASSGNRVKRGYRFSQATINLLEALTEITSKTQTRLIEEAVLLHKSSLKGANPVPK